MTLASVFPLQIDWLFCIQPDVTPYFRVVEIGGDNDQSTTEIKALILVLTLTSFENCFIDILTALYGTETIKYPVAIYLTDAICNLSS